MQILYCFVDESGDTTDKSPFIVAAIVIDNLVNILEHLQIIEENSKKGRIKWRKTSYERRVAYFRAVFSSDDLVNSLRYSVFEGETERHPATIRTIGRALLWNPPEGKFAVRVYVDALSKNLRHSYGEQLRKFGLRVDNVQGLKRKNRTPLCALPMRWQD